MTTQNKMTIYFFTKPSIDCIDFKVGFMTDDGQRLIASLWEQNGRHYVTKGSKARGDFQRFDFSDSQEKELENFCLSTASNKEYWAHPVK